MRLRLFDRVRRSGGLDSGSSRARRRGAEAPGRHRGPGPRGRDLWQERREPFPASPVPASPVPPRGTPAGPLPRRESLAGQFPRRDGPARFPRDGEAQVPESGPLPRGEAPAQFSRREAPPPFPPREAPAEMPRREARRRPPDSEPPRGSQEVAQVGGARARVRPWFTSPVRERPATRGTRAPGSAPVRDGRPAQDAKPAQRGRPGREAKRPWYETGGSRSRIRPAAPAGAREARPGAQEARPGAHGRPGDQRGAPDLPEAAARPAGAPPASDGRRHCGSLERVLHRQWDVAEPPCPEVVHAIDRLAELPDRLKDILAAGLDGIYVGAGGVPDLDDMRHLRGVPLPSGHATWDICAGAYGMRKIVVGARPSPTPDVMCHEVGHALDDIDAPEGQWQSDSSQFRGLYDRCLPHLVSDFHRQGDGLGRREFFADAFAAIASRQRPALVDMLGGNTRTALNVMLYFNRRYGI